MISLSVNDGAQILTAQAPNTYQVASAIQMQMQPNVTFSPLPFYELLDVITKPTSLIQNSISYQRSSLYFHLTQCQTELITNERLYNDSSFRYGVQVHLRFCLVDSTSVQDDHYPNRCKIVVNGKYVSIPGQPPSNAQNQEIKKPHRSINITTFCRALPTQQNEINIQWTPSLDLNQRFCATIHLVKVIEPDILINRLKEKPVRVKSQTLAFIKQKLCPDDNDNEIAMTSLKVSLCCPISMTRMSMPCRGNNCKHLQCFDGSNYIQINERRPTWVCPVCDQKAYFADLFRDELFAEIINEAKCDDIIFSEDGSWRPLDDSATESSTGQTNTMPSSPKQVSKSQTPPLVPVRTSSITTPPPNIEIGKDENTEVINIDDLDFDSCIPPLQPIKSSSCQLSNGNVPINSAPIDSSIVPLPPSMLSLSEPDIPGFDLYDIFPAVMDQNALHNTQVNAVSTAMSNNYTIPSMNNIIDLCDDDD